MQPIDDITLSKAMDELKKRGFEQDMLELIKKTADPEQFKIVEVYRFEGMTSPSDSSVLYAIESAGGQKGIVIDSYGINSDNQKTELLRNIQIVRP